MNKEHLYKLTTNWNGNHGKGTDDVRSYDRSHTVTIANKPALHLTTDNPHVGDKTKLNPEDLLVSALSSCHMLSYLYLCAINGIVVLDYTDNATGIMIENKKGGGSFNEVTLNPVVVLENESMVEKAIALHHEAHDICYIANSVNFPVYCRPICNTKLI